MDYLAAHDISLDVCPTSNVCTAAVPRLSGHPLPALLASGVPVTISTDDPGMFHTDLNREYLLCHTEFGLDTSALASLARTAAQAAFCPEPVRTAILAEIDQLTASITDGRPAGC
jgi:aminodeoxyfutalosine deaminase